MIEDGLAKQAMDPIAATVLGLAAYRAAILLERMSRRSDAQVLTTQVVDRIDPIRAATKDKELTAVVSMLYGLEIELSPIRGFYLGHRIQDILDSAHNDEKPNPRLHLAEGLGILYRPKLFGGGPANAVPILDAAIAGLDPEAPSDSSVCWGRADAMLALARAKIALNERSVAIKLVNDVIAQDPENPMAKWMRADLRSGADGSH